jgi:type II secretory pathway pseudopilin PulG
LLSLARNTQAGVSLVEALIALAVLSIMLVGSMSLFAVAQEGLSGGIKRLEAMALAESKLERMRTAAYHTLLSDDRNGDGNSGVVAADCGTGNAKATGVGERTACQTIKGILLTWSVRPDQPVLAQSRAVTIKVTAEWADQRGRRRAIQLGMRRANPVYGGGES